MSSVRVGYTYDCDILILSRVLQPKGHCFVLLGPCPFSPPISPPSSVKHLSFACFGLFGEPQVLPSPLLVSPGYHPAISTHDHGIPLTLPATSRCKTSLRDNFIYERGASSSLSNYPSRLAGSAMLCSSTHSSIKRWPKEPQKMIRKDNQGNQK